MFYNIRVDEAIQSLKFLSEKCKDLSLKVKKLENNNKEPHEQNEYYKRELSCAKSEF